MKTVKSLTLDDAKIAVEAMEAKSKEMKKDFCFCILDSFGNILILMKMDNTKSTSVEIAIAKAVTSLRFKTNSGNLGKYLKKNHIEMAALAGNCKTTISGGASIYEDLDDVDPVGAISASGGSSEEDGMVIEAGMEALGLKKK